MALFCYVVVTMALKHFFTWIIDTTAGPIVFDFDPTIAPFNVNFGVVPLDTNAGNVTVEITLDDLEIAPGIPNPNVRWSPDTGFTFTPGAGGISTRQYLAPISALRFTASGGANGDHFEFKSRQGHDAPYL